MLRSVSPVAWRHINLIGKFEFTPEAADIDLDALAVRFADPGYCRQALDKGGEGTLT